MPRANLPWLPYYWPAFTVHRDSGHWTGIGNIKNLMTLQMNRSFPCQLYGITFLASFWLRISHIDHLYHRNNITNEISAGVAVGAAAHSIGKSAICRHPTFSSTCYFMVQSLYCLLLFLFTAVTNQTVLSFVWNWWREHIHILSLHQLLQHLLNALTFHTHYRHCFSPTIAPSSGCCG